LQDEINIYDDPITATMFRHSIRTMRAQKKHGRVGESDQRPQTAYKKKTKYHNNNNHSYTAEVLSKVFI